MTPRPMAFKGRQTVHLFDRKDTILTPWTGHRTLCGIQFYGDPKEPPPNIRQCQTCTRAVRRDAS